MCLGTVGKLIEILDSETARFEVMGAEVTAAINFVPQAKLDDFCMLHAGAAIAIVDEKEEQIFKELFYELLEVNKGTK